MITDPLTTEAQFQAVLAAAGINPADYPVSSIAYLRRRLTGLSVAKLHAAAPSGLLLILLLAIEDTRHLASGKPGDGMFLIQWEKATLVGRRQLWDWTRLEGSPEYDSRG